jgi:hypothetical protein
MELPLVKNASTTYAISTGVYGAIINPSVMEEI